jgi:hypothetical protein
VSVVGSPASNGRKAAESARRLAALVENSSDSIVGVDVRGVIQSWNTGAQRLFGYTASDMIGRGGGVLIPPGRTDELEEVLGDDEQFIDSFRFETQLVRLTPPSIEPSKRAQQRRACLSRAVPGGTLNPAAQWLTRLAASSPVAPISRRFRMDLNGLARAGAAQRAPWRACCHLRLVDDDLAHCDTTPPSELPLVVGQTIAGRYRVGNIIGEGGMGIVCAATHVGLGTPVAVKLIRSDLKGDLESVQRFVNEARTAAALKGEHVARVFDVGQLETGEPYLVMEHLEGVSLDAFIHERGPLGQAEAVDIVLQAWEGLAEAHAVSLVHRDI